MPHRDTLLYVVVISSRRSVVTMCRGTGRSTIAQMLPKDKFPNKKFGVFPSTAWSCDTREQRTLLSQLLLFVLLSLLQLDSFFGVSEHCGHKVHQRNLPDLHFDAQALLTMLCGFLSFR